MIKNRILLLTLTILFAIVLSGTVSATSNDTYAIGENITQEALKDTNLGLNQSDKNLVITSAGSAKLNNKTTEGSLSGIINAASSLTDDQKITYGNGNLVQINDPYESLRYIFVSKSSSGTLVAKKFLVNPNGSSYTITSSDSVFISADITQSQWNYAKEQLGDDLFNVISIANAWANGAPIDLLALAESNGRIVPGTISGYAATKAFIKQYSNFNSSKEYVILTVPGGYDDDGIIYFAVWNYKLNALNGSNPLETAYIQWDTKTKKGTLVLVKFNESLLNEFENLKGLKVVTGTLSEIQFSNWLLDVLKSNPEHLLNIEKTAVINQTDLDYLYGNSTQPGKGLSEEGRNYIFNLTSASTPLVIPSTILSPDKYDEFVIKGNDIAQQAVTILNGLPNSYGDISVSTAPVYVTVGGILIHGFYDGFASVLGTDPNNLISLGNPYNFDSYVNNRYFNSVFYIKGVNSTGGQVVYAIHAKYDVLTDNLTWSNPVDVTKGLETPEGIPGVSTGVGGTDHEFFYSGMHAMPWSVTGYIWSVDLPYDIKKSWNKIGHCMSPPKIIAANLNILSQLPLGHDEYYILIGQGSASSSGDTARTDAARTYGLDVYPGSGTFYTPGDSSKTIVLRWNDKTKTGTASIITFDSSLLSTLQKQEPEYANVPSPVWFADVLTGKAKTSLSDIAKAFIVNKEIRITENDLSALKASGEDPFKFIQDFVNPTTSTDTSDNQQDNTPNTSAGQSTGVTGQSVSAVSSQSTSTGSSAGDQGQTTPGSTSTAQTGTASEVSAVGRNSSSTGGSQTPLVAGIGIAILVVLVGFGFYKGGLGGLIGK